MNFGPKFSKFTCQTESLQQPHISSVSPWLKLWLSWLLLVWGLCSRPCWWHPWVHPGWGTSSCWPQPPPWTTQWSPRGWGLVRRGATCPWPRSPPRETSLSESPGWCWQYGVWLHLVGGPLSWTSSPHRRPPTRSSPWPGSLSWRHQLWSSAPVAQREVAWSFHHWLPSQTHYIQGVLAWRHRLNVDVPGRQEDLAVAAFDHLVNHKLLLICPEDNSRMPWPLILLQSRQQGLRSLHSLFPSRGRHHRHLDRGQGLQSCFLHQCACRCCSSPSDILSVPDVPHRVLPGHITDLCRHWQVWSWWWVGVPCRHSWCPCHGCWLAWWCVWCSQDASWSSWQCSGQCGWPCGVSRRRPCWCHLKPGWSCWFSWQFRSFSNLLLFHEKSLNLGSKGMWQLSLLHLTMHLLFVAHGHELVPDGGVLHFSLAEVNSDWVSCL